VQEVAASGELENVESSTLEEDLPEEQSEQMVEETACVTDTEPDITLPDAEDEASIAETITDTEPPPTQGTSPDLPRVSDDHSQVR